MFRIDLVRLNRLFAICVMVCAGAILNVSAFATGTQAAECPPSTIGGPSVGSVRVGDISVPLKRVRYRNGGPLHPPASNQNAGISIMNATIGAEEGTSVITWHIRYGPGCPGTLNELATLPPGSTFAVRMKGQQAVEYSITTRTEVRKGRYKAAWFRSDGKHRLALFTCGDFRDGVFQSTIVTLAEPVRHESGGSAPDGEGADT